MIPAVQHKHPQLAALCRKYGVRRLEFFGSAAAAEFHAMMQAERGFDPAL